MAELNSPMDVLKLLDKSNCKKCGKPTCLAFAAAVYKGEKSLDDCPQLDKEILERFGGKPEERMTYERQVEASVEEMKKKISDIDLASAAPRLGARFSDGKLTLKTLGKDFSVDSEGNLYSDIHIHTWIAIPVLTYIIEGKGTPPTGKWVPLRELKNGMSWGPLFGQRGEKPLKKVADTYTDLFEDMIHLFSGKQVEKQYDSDISLVLYPLPKVPMLICYWQPEEGLESSLHLFFDETAEENLNIESIYTLGTGLARMFEKISQRHGY
jgi:hypothetical protein